MRGLSTNSMYFSLAGSHPLPTLAEVAAVLVVVVVVATSATASVVGTGVCFFY